MKDEILKLRSKGYSYNRISKELGCAKSTVCYYCSDGQVEKARDRKRKNRAVNKRAILTRKVDRLRVVLKNRTRDFQRRNGGYLTSKMERNFTINDLLEKIGESPSCYLTGRTIDLYNRPSYHMDHIIPPEKGGTNELSNLNIAIKEANIAKQDMTIEEFLSFCSEVLQHNGYRVTKK